VVNDKHAKRRITDTVQGKVRRVVLGTGISATGLRTVSRKVSGFVGRLHVDTTVKEVLDVLTAAGVKDPECKKLESKDGKIFNTAAFFVSCACDDFDKLFCADIWPNGCEVREWIFKPK
jgi:hypothetical protein